MHACPGDSTPDSLEKAACSRERNEKNVKKWKSPETSGLFQHVKTLKSATSTKGALGTIKRTSASALGKRTGRKIICVARATIIPHELRVSTAATRSDLRTVVVHTPYTFEKMMLFYDYCRYHVMYHFQRRFEFGRIAHMRHVLMNSEGQHENVDGRLTRVPCDDLTWTCGVESIQNTNWHPDARTKKSEISDSSTCVQCRQYMSIVKFRRPSRYLLKFTSEDFANQYCCTCLL